MPTGWASSAVVDPREVLLRLRLGPVLAENRGQRLLAEQVDDLLQVVALIVLFFIGYSAWLSAHQMSGEA